jgi:hypothetical protein
LHLTIAGSGSGGDADADADADGIYSSNYNGSYMSRGSDVSIL